MAPIRLTAVFVKELLELLKDVPVADSSSPTFVGRCLEMPEGYDILIMKVPRGMATPGHHILGRPE